MEVLYTGCIFDAFDEQDLRGLEINSALLDQAEEIKEPIYNVLDARIGRWDQAQVPLPLLRSQLTGQDFEESLRIEKDKPKELTHFIKLNTTWPRHRTRGHFLVPNYMDVLCNVADDEEFHWTYRYYNPESFEKKPDHFYIHREMDTNLGDDRSYQQMMLRDQTWVDKYVLGKRGTGGATIHRLEKISVINPDDYPKEEFDKFLEIIKSRAALYRILDHGETGVTCCLWCAALNNIHIFFREYYVNSTLISINRQAIHDLSFDEEYATDYADPQIFKITQQTISGIKSGFQTVAAEYADTDLIDAPPLYWNPADNNELATRNRINELLVLNPKYFHPLSKVSPAPGIYFIKKTLSYPYGCEQAIIQIKQQRKKLIGSDNGRNIYSIERDDSIVDHAYDCTRYYVAMHHMGPKEKKRAPVKNSFAFFNSILKKRPKYTSMITD